MPDPTPVGVPDVTFLERMANAMFREAIESVGASEAFPGSLGPALGGLRGALPADQRPGPSMGSEPNSLGSIVPPDAGPRRTGTPLGGLGIAFPSTPRPDLSVPGVAQPSHMPSGGDPSINSAGQAVPSTPFPQLGAPGIGAPGIVPPGNFPFEGIGNSPPLGGFGAPPPAASLSSATLPEVPALGLDVPGEAELRALLAAGTTPVPQPTMPIDPISAAIPGVAVPGGTMPGIALPPGTPIGNGTPTPTLPALGFDIPGEAELFALLSGTREIGTQPTVPIDATLDYYFRPKTTAPAAASASPGGFDVNLVRRDFPILSERVNGKPLIWLDNAATTQKPQAVIDRLSYFYEHENSNVHRAAHELAARATDAYEKARETVKRFINASSTREIVFVRGTTEAINLISNTWGRRFLGKGDEIVITWLEHHANIVPWQMLCEQTGAILKVAPVDDSGQVKLDEYGKLLGRRTKLVSFTAVSNALGTVTPAKVMTDMAHTAGARVLYDAAQSVSHMRSDVQALDVDWFVFSGHKVFGPTGIGVVYGKPDVLEESPPWQGGGNMIVDVTFERTEYQPPPGRFEAGTGNIADAVGLGAALEYVERIGIESIGRYEHDLLEYATHRLRDIRGLRLIGTAREKAGVISFVLDGIETTTVGRELNEEGIAVRAGHHCAQPILRRFGVETSVRPSLALYNTFAEIDTLAAAVRRIQAKHAPYRQAL